MAGLTLSDAQEILDQYKSALIAVLKNQSYTVSGPDGGRTFTKADLKEINAGILQWNQIVVGLTNARVGGRTRRVIPV